MVDTYGYSAKAVDAGSKKSLLVRHQVLSNVCNMSGKNILDVGCGFGDMGNLLLRKYSSQWTRYVGIDISRRMIEEGRKVFPGLQLQQADVNDWAQQSDIVLAQGIFYKLGENAEEKTKHLIRKMWGLTKTALAFTAIYNWSDQQGDNDEYRVNPVRLLDFCRTLTDRLVLKTDHWPGDCAIYMYV